MFRFPAQTPLEMKVMNLYLATEEIFRGVLSIGHQSEEDSLIGVILIFKDSREREGDVVLDL